MKAGLCRQVKVVSVGVTSLCPYYLCEDHDAICVNITRASGHHLSGKYLWYLENKVYYKVCLQVIFEAGLCLQ